MRVDWVDIVGRRERGGGRVPGRGVLYSLTPVAGQLQAR